MAQEAFDEGRLDLIEIGLAVVARRRLPRIEMRALLLRDGARLKGVAVPRAGTIVALAVVVIACMGYLSRRPAGR